MKHFKFNRGKEKVFNKFEEHEEGKKHIEGELCRRCFKGMIQH